MERKIGEIFEVEGQWYQCIKGMHCHDCDFKMYKCKTLTKCRFYGRKNGDSVIFKKLDKVGEPITVNGKKVQLLKTTIANCDNCAFYKDINCDFTCYPRKCYGGEEGTYVEIKQSKEDMEEKKPTYEELLHYYNSTVGLLAIDKNPQEVSLDWICDNAFQLWIDEKDSNSENIGKNLRKFDLEAAKSGKPVCTRDGRKARIICFDLKNDEYPIVAAVGNDSSETLFSYTTNGEIADGIESDKDLMMLTKN